MYLCSRITQTALVHVLSHQTIGVTPVHPLDYWIFYLPEVDARDWLQSRKSIARGKGSSKWSELANTIGRIGNTITERASAIDTDKPSPYQSDNGSQDQVRARSQGSVSALRIGFIRFHLSH